MGIVRNGLIEMAQFVGKTVDINTQTFIQLSVSAVSFWVGRTAAETIQD